MISNLDFTFIGKNTFLNGEFIFSNSTKLAGKIEGKITAAKNAKLSLEMGSFTKGTIKGYDIDIYGHFEGEIEANGIIRVFPTAYIEGKIVAKSLEVLPGANLNITGHTDLTNNL
jgi:cytoskeletal protein CcmA (bactofilin family)